MPLIVIDITEIHTGDDIAQSANHYLVGCLGR